MARRPIAPPPDEGARRASGRATFNRGRKSTFRGGGRARQLSRPAARVSTISRRKPPSFRAEALLEE